MPVFDVFPDNESSEEEEEDYYEDMINVFSALAAVLDEVPRKRRRVARVRKSWKDYLEPIDEDGFKRRFRCTPAEFDALVANVNPYLQNNSRMGDLAGGSIEVEVKVADYDL